MKTYYHATKKKIPYRKVGTCDLHTLPVFWNSIEEELKSKIYEVEKHLDSQRDPRLSSTVVICLTICLENKVMRGNPRSSEFSGILQGKGSPILSCFYNFFPLPKEKENKGAKCTNFSRKSDSVFKHTVLNQGLLSFVVSSGTLDCLTLNTCNSSNTTSSIFHFSFEMLTTLRTVPMSEKIHYLWSSCFYFSVWL